MTTHTSWIIPATTAFLGGGFFVGISQVIKAVSDSRKSRAEESNVFLGGAEQAFTLMERAIARAEAEVESLKHEQKKLRDESHRKDRRITELETELIRLRTQLESITGRVDKTVERIHEVQNNDKDNEL